MIEKIKNFYIVGGRESKKDLLVERLSSITQIRNEDIKIYNKFSKLVKSRTLKSFLKE